MSGGRSGLWRRLANNPGKSPSRTVHYLPPFPPTVQRLTSVRPPALVLARPITSPPQIESCGLGGLSPAHQLAVLSACENAPDANQGPIAGAEMPAQDAARILGKSPVHCLLLGFCRQRGSRARLDGSPSRAAPPTGFCPKLFLPRRITVNAPTAVPSHP